MRSPSPAFYRHVWMADSALDRKAGSIGLSERIRDAEACPALKVLDEEREGWGYRLPGDAGDLWGWCVEQPQDVLLDLLAFLASQSVNAVRQKHERATCDRLRHANQMARAAGLDMTRWWGTDEAFLSRLNKAQIAAAVKDGTGSIEVAATL